MMFSPSHRGIIFLIRVCTAIFFGSSVLLSYPLWMTNRPFPLFPILPLVPSLPPPFDILAPALLAFFAFGICIPRWSRMSFAVTTSLLTLLVLADITRLTPWVVVSVIILAITITSSSRSPAHDARAVHALRLLAWASYLHSGFRSLAPLLLIAPTISSSLPLTHSSQPSLFGAFAPSASALCAVLLMTRLRYIAVLCLVALHAGMITITPLSFSSGGSVLHHIFAIVTLPLLFWNIIPFRVSIPLPFFHQWNTSRTMTAFALCVPLILPSLAIGSMYSVAGLANLRPHATLTFDRVVAATLPESVWRLSTPVSEGTTIPVSSLMRTVLHTDSFTTVFMHRRLFFALCDTFQHRGVSMIVRTVPVLPMSATEYTLHCPSP